MSKDEILKLVIEVLASSFELERARIQPTSHLFEELDLDSIDAIDLVVGLEEETGLKVADEELRQIRLVQDVVDVIHRRIGSA